LDLIAPDRSSRTARSVAGKQRNLPLEVDGRKSVAGEGNREGERRGVHGTKVAGETRKKAVRSRRSMEQQAPEERLESVA